METRASSLTGQGQSASGKRRERNPRKRLRDTPSKQRKSTDKLRSTRAPLAPTPQQRPANREDQKEEELQQPTPSGIGHGSAKSIFTDSFAPMHLHSSTQESQSAPSSSSSSNSSNTVAAILTTTTATTTTASESKSVSNACDNQEGDSSTAVMPSDDSCSTSPSQISPDSPPSKADSHTNSDSFLPPLPTTITCPHPSSYPPAPRLPPLRSQPSGSQTHLDTTADPQPYCPSLFDKGLPRLPTEYRLERPARPLSVDLHGSSMHIVPGNNSQSKSQNQWQSTRKQRDQRTYSQHQPPSLPIDYQHDSQSPYSLHYRPSEESCDCIDCWKTSVIRPAHLTRNQDGSNFQHHDLSIAMRKPIFHGRKAGQAQTKADTHQRRKSGRSTGDLQQVDNESMEASRQDALMTPTHNGINGGGPIQSHRLRPRGNTASSYSSSRRSTPPLPGATKGGRNGQKKATLSNVRTAIACELCRSMKRKCSGGLPCELCVKRSRQAECRYDPGPTSNQANIVQSSLAKNQADDSVEVNERAALPHNPRKKSRKVKRTNLEEDEVEVEQSLTGHDRSDIGLADGMEQDAASESDVSSYEFDDEKPFLQQSRYQQPRNYQTAVASTSSAPLLPPIHSTSPRTTGHPTDNYQGWYGNQASAYGYSSPSMPYSSPNAVLQYSVHTSPIDFAPKTFNEWNSEQVTIQSRGRSSSGSGIQSSRPDHRYAGQAAPFYPAVSSASGYALTSSPMSHAGLYAPVSSPHQLNYTAPSPPFQHMSHPMQRSHIETHRTPAVPNGWSSSEASRQSASRPCTSSGIPSVDNRELPRPEEVPRGAVVATFLKAREKKRSRSIPGSTSVVGLAISSDIASAEGHKEDIVKTATKGSNSKPKKIRKKIEDIEIESPSPLNKLVEAVDLTEAEAARPKRYHTRSQTRA